LGTNTDSNSSKATTIMTREEAREILHELTETESLLRHSRSVELVMEAYAEKYGEDPEEWAIAGMLHDADYEKFPEEHPNKIVATLPLIRLYWQSTNSPAL
jgi:predicted hydrolase (HD superfamily)